MIWRTLTTSVSQFMAAGLASSHASQQSGFGPRRLWWGQVIGTFSRRGPGSADPACQEPFSDRETVVGLPVVGSGDSLATLADRIEAVHHEGPRRELARLGYVLASVIGSHSDPTPELLEMRDLFGLLRALLEAHMIQEEQRLFPRCRALQSGRRWPGSIQDTISVMTYQHEELLSTMMMVQRSAHALAPPEEADTRHQALREGLAELDAVLHRHIQEEDDILFPMASAAEAAWSWRSFYHRWGRHGLSS